MTIQEHINTARELIERADNAHLRSEQTGTILLALTQLCAAFELLADMKADRAELPRQRRENWLNDDGGRRD